MGERNELSNRLGIWFLLLSLAGCHLGLTSSHTAARNERDQAGGTETVSVADSSYDLEGALQLGNSGGTLFGGVGLGFYEVARRSESMSLIGESDWNIRYPIGLSFGIPISRLGAELAAYASYDYYWISSVSDDLELKSILELGLQITAGSFFVRTAYSSSSLALGVDGDHSTSGITFSFGLRIHHLEQRIAKLMNKEDD